MTVTQPFGEELHRCHTYALPGGSRPGTTAVSLAPTRGVPSTTTAGEPAWTVAADPAELPAARPNTEMVATRIGVRGFNTMLDTAATTPRRAHADPSTSRRPGLLPSRSGRRS